MKKTLDKITMLCLNRKHIRKQKVAMAKLMNIDELANYLRLQKQTIYNWLSQGKISGIKVGGVWRFDKKDVETWLKSRRSLVKYGEGRQ